MPTWSSKVASIPIKDGQSKLEIFQPSFGFVLSELNPRKMTIEFRFLDPFPGYIAKCKIVRCES